MFDVNNETKPIEIWVYMRWGDNPPPKENDDE